MMVKLMMNCSSTIKDIDRLWAVLLVWFFHRES